MYIVDKLHQRAIQLSQDLRNAESALLVLLMEMKRTKSFAALGYSGIFSYCERALKLSEAQCFYFKKVVEKSEEVPELKVAVTQGTLSLSQARRIVPVINQTNHAEWIEKARTLPQKELERAVTVVNPEARFPKERIKPTTPNTSELKVSLSREAEDDLKRLQDLFSKKLGRAVGLGEVVALALKQAVDKQDPVKRAQRLSLRKAKSVRLKPGRNPIPAKVRHVINLRDQGQCTFRSKEGHRCEERRWTEMHHRVPVSCGGGNEADNIQTLCGAHHRFTHD